MKKLTDQNLERKWNDVEQEKMRKYDENEAEKARQEKEKIKQQMDFINKQYHESKIRKILDYQEQVVEGQIIKKRVLEALDEDK